MRRDAVEADITWALLEKIRARPAMYLGEKDLPRLKSLLDGYCLREMEREPDCVQNNGFWDGFCRYVEDYYHVTTSQGWCRIIEFYSTSRADAFDKFFRRYDEYLAAYRAGETPPPRF